MRWYTAIIICTITLGLPNWCVATGFYVPQQTAYGAGRANAGSAQRQVAAFNTTVAEFAVKYPEEAGYSPGNIL